jgi:hypothetical protein
MDNKIHLIQGMVAQAYNPSTQEPEQEGGKFKASLSYLMRLCLKNANTKS